MVLLLRKWYIQTNRLNIFKNLVLIYQQLLLKALSQIGAQKIGAQHYIDKVRNDGGGVVFISYICWGKGIEPKIWLREGTQKLI